MSDDRTKEPRQTGASTQQLTAGDREVVETLRSGLSDSDQRWLDDVLARQAQSERDAEERGEALPGPMW